MYFLESPARNSISSLHKVRSRSTKTSQSQLLNSQSQKPSAATEAARASASSSYIKLSINPSLEAIVPDARATEPDARAKRVRAGVKDTDPRVFLFLSDYLQSEDKGCFISFLCNIYLHSRLLRSGSKRKFKRFLYSFNYLQLSCIPTQGKECLISFIAKSNSQKPQAKQCSSKSFSSCDYNKGDYTQSWRRSWLSQDAN